MRAAALLILGVLALAALLGATGVIELPLGLLRPAAETSSDDGLEAGSAEAAARRGGGARLEGAAGAGRHEPGVRGSASEVYGSVPRGARIVGRVIEPGVTPLPIGGARVSLVRPHPVTSYLKTPAEGRWDALEAVTDAAGRFTFADVRPARGYVVRARVSGRPSASTRRLDLGPRQVLDAGDLALLEGGAFAGRVLDGAQRPIARARVAVTWRVESILGMVLYDPESLPAIEAQALTDEHGRFLLEGLEAGPKTLVVATSANGGKVLGRPEAVAGQRTDLGDIVLAGTGVVAGSVRWDDGAPVVGARVFCGEPRMDRPTLFSTHTGPDGAFRLEHLEGTVARLGAFVPGIPVVPSGDVAVGTLEHVITLPAAGSITGRVVRKADRSPVARFEVRLVPQGQEDFVARAVRNLVDAAVGPLGCVSPEGVFRIPFQAHGRYVLEVTAEGFPAQRSEPFEVRAHETVDIGSVALAEGHLLGGSVRTSLGAPLEGARVRLLSGTTDVRIDRADVLFGDLSGGERPDAVSDAGGQFLLAAQTPGLYGLLVEHPHAVHTIVGEVDLRSGPRPDVEVVMQPAGEVRVRVLDARGRAADDVDVVLVRLDGFALEAETQDGGQARWESIPVGACIVRCATLEESVALRTAAYTDDAEARAKAYEALRREVPEQIVRAGEITEVLLRLPARVEVTLRVRPWASDLKPLRAVSVRHAPSFWQRYLSTSEAGVFRLPLEPGTYEVRVFPESGWDDSRVFELVVPDAPTYVADLGG